MHKTIKRFGIEGLVSDKAIPQTRDHFEAELIRSMKDEGYVPVLGLGPFWSTDYNADKDEYRFILSIHGVYVGRKKACQIVGISVDGRIVPSTTQTR